MTTAALLTALRGVARADGISNARWCLVAFAARLVVVAAGSIPLCQPFRVKLLRVRLLLCALVLARSGRGLALQGAAASAAQEAQVWRRLGCCLCAGC